MNKTRIVKIQQYINDNGHNEEIQTSIHVGPCYAHIVKGDGGTDATTLVAQVKNGKLIPHSGHPTLEGLYDILDMIILHTP